MKRTNRKKAANVSKPSPASPKKRKAAKASEPQLSKSNSAASGDEPMLAYRMSPAATAALAEAMRLVPDNADYRRLTAIEAAMESWSDEAIVAELAAMPVLPEDSLSFPDEHIEQIGDRYDFFHSLVALVGSRQLKRAVPLVLAKICQGEPGEMFRDFIPDSLSCAVGEDWDYLVQCCVDAIRTGRPGAVDWAIQTMWYSKSMESITRLALPTLRELRDTDPSAAKLLEKVAATRK